MPVCFELARKNNPQGGAVPLNAIDRELCEFLCEPVDDVKYVFGWYDFIGFRLACGEKFDEIRASIEKNRLESLSRPIPEHFRDNPEVYQFAIAEYYGSLRAICDYLDENFTSDCWREIGKR